MTSLEDKKQMVREIAGFIATGKDLNEVLGEYCEGMDDSEINELEDLYFLMKKRRRT
jgi:hypothetical protein